MVELNEFQRRDVALEGSYDGSSAPRILRAPVPVRRPVRMHATPAKPAASGLSRILWPYVQMARLDHWFKNAFMLPGVVFAVAHRPELLSVHSAARAMYALTVACLLASSNYVLNEYLDGPLDRLHPTKRWRPAARGLVKGWAALLIWGALGALGVSAGIALNSSFGAVAFLFWMMACAYNIPPVRTKDIAYIDVLSESANNPLRLFLGWFALIPDVMPPLSLGIAYWMVGAFFMAAKRYAEYRQIDDPEVASSYRPSFRHYDDARLMASMFFYMAVGSVFAGVFLLRYKLELVLFVPPVAAFLAYYALIAMRTDSPVQNPEKLYRERGVLVAALVVLIAFITLMSVDIPVLYEVFNVLQPNDAQLWTIQK